jgi:hypothetical protein
MQQQMFSLAALAERDALKPFAQPAPPPPAVDDDDEADDEAFAQAFFTEYFHA